MKGVLLIAGGLFAFVLLGAANYNYSRSNESRPDEQPENGTLPFNESTYNRADQNRSLPNNTMPGRTLQNGYTPGQSIIDENEYYQNESSGSTRYTQPGQNWNIPSDEEQNKSGYYHGGMQSGSYYQHGTQNWNQNTPSRMQPGMNSNGRHEQQGSTNRH